MKQVLISMLAKQGDTSNPLGAEKSVSAREARAKRVGRTVEEESPKQPKPTVFVSVRSQPLNPNLKLSGFFVRRLTGSDETCCGPFAGIQVVVNLLLSPLFADQKEAPEWHQELIHGTK